MHILCIKVTEILTFDTDIILVNLYLSIERIPVTVRNQPVSSRRQVDGFRHQSSCGDQRVSVFLSVEFSGQRGRVQGEGRQ